MERKWIEKGVRYGSLTEVETDVLEEVDALYPLERLNEIIQGLETAEEGVPEKKKSTVTLAMLDNPDWKVRYAILDRMNPTLADIPVLIKALQDEKATIRRQAVVYLGMIEDESVLPYIIKALQDNISSVRRTAGDCLSDIGNPVAIPSMIAALKDKNKLVRWRAAMFLYEVGDETALSALKEAEEDCEFEVSMQIKLALARIAGGEVAKGSVWKQMTEYRLNQ